MLDLTRPDVKEGNVLDELAKQLSAFANTGGGRIVYGVDNAGAIDNGGIARVLKGRQPTKEWLEDLIPALTEFEIEGVPTTRAVLFDILASDEFRSGEYSTSFLEEAGARLPALAGSS